MNSKCSAHVKCEFAGVRQIMLRCASLVNSDGLLMVMYDYTHVYTAIEFRQTH